MTSPQLTERKKHVDHVKKPNNILTERQWCFSRLLKVFRNDLFKKKKTLSADKPMHIVQFQASGKSLTRQEPVC